MSPPPRQHKRKLTEKKSMEGIYESISQKQEMVMVEEVVSVADAVDVEVAVGAGEVRGKYHHSLGPIFFNYLFSSTVSIEMFVYIKIHRTKNFKTEFSKRREQLSFVFLSIFSCSALLCFQYTLCF